MESQIKSALDISNEEYLPEMRYRLKEKTGWNDDKMDKVVKEYFRFIQLVTLYSNGEIDQEVTPSHDIDETWHNHMLFSRDYFKFCDKVAGTYLHH